MGKEKETQVAISIDVQGLEHVLHSLPARLRFSRLSPRRFFKNERFRTRMLAFFLVAFAFTHFNIRLSGTFSD